MPPRGLKMRNRGCFEMYLIIYRKDGKMDYLATLKDNWKDALCDFMRGIGEVDNEDLIDLYKKSIAMLTLPDAIRLMYIFNGKDVIIADIFTGMQKVNTSLGEDLS